MAASHYETLGVAEGADPDAVRRAYLELARRLHPDRWIDASGDDRASAHRRMQEINEAWRVLGNAGRRLAYDAGRRRSTRTTAGVPSAPFPSGDLFVDEAPPDVVSRLVRSLPWALVLLALGVIFVFTAYATGDGDVRSCVHLDGSTAVSVPCDDPGARTIQLRVANVAQCPPDTEAFQPAGTDQALCLRT